MLNMWVNHPICPGRIADHDLQPEVHQLYLTAVTNDTCISISGHPDALKLFKSQYLPSSAYSSRYASIHTLYHSPELQDVKTLVMDDIIRRDIRFPSRTSLHRSVRSTVSGQVISKDRPDCSLAEEVVDMTLLHPVNFDLVIDTVREELAARKLTSLRLVNIGPGNALWRSISKALPSVQFDMVDWSSTAQREAAHAPSARLGPAAVDVAACREPIAIVGMAVKFPGAEDSAGLWKVLEEGLNTVSEVGPSPHLDIDHRD